MLVIIPYFAGDKPQAVRLAKWIEELGGVSKHDCLLAVHKDTDSSGVIEPLRRAFGRVAEFSVTDDMIVERSQHAYAANLMWKRTANHIADMNEPADWLWLEPDAVPLNKGWLDNLTAAHAKSGKAFLHTLVETPRGRSNSGCGIYPAKVRDYTDRLWELSNVSWDVLLYPDFAPHTAYTPLIQDIGFMPGTKDLPTFLDADSLSILNPDAVLFHRSKDGSLIDRLRERCSGTALLASAPAKSGDEGFGIVPSLKPAAPPRRDWERQMQEAVDEQDEKLSIALARVAELEKRLAERDKPKPKNAAKVKKKLLTPEEQAKIDARMAKARAGRKAVVKL